MACLYYVNGNWISENQFKELLNNGLLDNLIKDKKLDLKGFKLDSSKLIETKTEEVTTSTISAVKLASILAEEVKGRSGYPINMLSALELNTVRNADGTINEELTDFKIPLWASPYASKFESLLTSLVSNKVIKQKLPGNSYVLGSEEGFKIKEGDAAAGDLKNSNIVFTEKFDASKGLQPLRWDPEAKKMLPAQIMIPFKFRDESGKILDLKQFTIKGPDGRVMLDMEKIPEKLLMLFGFRIPTQKQNSMAAVEVVGFLPETSGDLILAPRDFTKQMGSDFDVDKLYTYMYNHYFLNGKLYTNFVSDTKKINKLLEIAKQQLENIKIEYKLSKEEKKLIDKYIKEKSEADERGEPVSSELAQKVSALIEESMTVERGKGYPILEEFKEKIDNAVNTISVLNRSYKAARQNNILDIHLKVMLSSNPEVISAILALDSSGDFKKLSEDIYRVRVERGLVDPIVSILSETYQRTKFINATAGKNGVGYFSLDSTFNASAQGKELVYDNLTDEVRDDLYQNGRPTYQQVLENNMPVATFGESVSKGDLSNKYTLRSQLIIDKAKAEGRELTSEEKASLKLKSLVIRSLQSASVDNEKEQILDKLNISDETIHAIRALTILGFEEDEISGLLTQEIIWEFVENIKEAGSSLSPYNANAKEDVFKALTLKYDPEGKFDELSIINLTLLQGQSAEKLLDNVFSDIKKLKVPENKVTPDYNLEQLALLQKFMRLSEIGLQINAVQSAVNSESKGVPTSLIETRAKVEQINNLSSSPIFNAMNLIGKTSIEDGVRKVTPNNINGFAAMYGTFFANDIFKKYFPYDSQGFKTIVSEITAHMPARSSMSVSAATQLKKDVFSEIKSYLFANSNTNLFNGNPDFARRILFIDNQENTSLARKLSMLQSQTWFQRNGFLNKLDFDLNKNGQPSRVNFEAATGENFDERNIYDGFIYLIDKNFAVGTFKVDGKDVEYTSRMLAQELVTAAYLEGGMQGAKQYLKYIPNAYLKTIGFGEYLQGVEFDFQSNFFGTIPESGPGYTYGMPSRFTRQFFQNNPDKSKTVTFGMIEGNPTKIPDSFVIKKDLLGSNFIQVSDHISGEPTLEQTKFVSIYDTKLPGKYALYEFDSVARIYRRIPTLLGSYGFVQYNSERGTVVPLEAINSTTSPLPEIATPGYELKNIPTAPTKEFTTGVVNNPTPVVESNNLNLSENLSGTKEALDDLLNVLADSSSISTLHSHLIETLRELELPADFKLIYDNNILGRGSFRASDNTLIINLKHPQNQAIDNLANVVTHELIHAHTSKVITLYQMGNLSSLTQKQIQSIQKLEALQATYIENLVKEEGSERLKQFNQLFNNWKVAEVKSGRSSVEAANEFKKLQNFLKAGDLSKYYGAIKLTEFVTMALTDTGFQERLNNIKDAEGISMWTKIKEAILDILNALGLDVQPGSALAYAIKDSMDLIQANQEELKKNLIETKEFIEFGTKYRFEVNSEGNVTKAEFAQGNYTVFKPMNKTNAKKTYDRLSKSSATQVTAPSKVNTTLVNDSSKFTNYSGAAEGADTEWENIGKEFGIGQQVNYRPQDLQNLTPERQQEIEESYQRAVVTLGRRPLAYDWQNPNAKNSEGKSLYYSGGLVRRDYLQAEKADAVFAIIEGFDKVNGIFVPKGGTGYATMMAVEMQKPVFIFNQADNQWYEARYLSEDEGNGFYGFEQTSTPTLTSSFAGIGTRQINKAGKQAIRDVYENTFKSTTQSSTSVKPKGTINVYWGQAESATSTKILSNLAPREFTWNGRIYGSVEHAYQVNKSGTFDQNTYDAYVNAGGYGTKIRGKAVTKGFDNLQLMKDLVVESFIQNPTSEATKKLLQYDKFTHNTNEIIDKAFLEGLKLAQQTLLSTQPSTSVENLADNKYEIFPGVFTNQGQTAAIDKMTNFLVGQDKTFLLKGRGGTGKTTIVKMVMDKSNIPHSKILGATVSDEARGILADNLPSTIKTKTIASALGLVPDFNSKTGELYFRERNIQEQKDFDARGKSDAIENAELIIIDEASMVGEDIYDILMRKKRPSAKVIFMGDNAQIPPIMPDGSSKDSPVFKLLEGTKTFAELTQRMRQGEESPILPVTDVYAENIESMQRGEQGKENPLTSRISNFDPNTNSGVIFTNNRQEIVDGFVADFQNNPDNLKNAVIIGARNEVVDNFAQLVRNKLFDNPSEPFVIGDIIRVNSPFVQGKEVLYANGFKGKVIAVESSGIDPLLNLEKFFITVEYDSTDNSGITSRKTTRMTTISPQDKKSLKSMLQALAVKAKNKQIPWQTYYQIKESIVDLGYNYAMTSHKVQGSTYQNVYILEEDIMSFPGGRLQRNRMIYTAVSRPTTKLVVYSSKSTPITKKGLDMGVFTEAGINPEALSQKPAEDTYYGEENTFRSEEKNTDYYDDYEAYRRMKNSEDDMIEESPLNSDAIRNYLLICGK
jgi:exodeoxyribonuclease-5